WHGRIIAWRGSCHVLHPVSTAYLHAERGAAPEQRVEDGLRAIRGRKELPRLLPLQAHAHRREPAYGRLDVEGGQDVANDRARAVEVLGMDRLVGDVTASAARNQNLGADASGALE